MKEAKFEGTILSVNVKPDGTKISIETAFIPKDTSNLLEFLGTAVDISIIDPQREITDYENDKKVE